MADQRKGEERNGTEGENRGDGIRGVFVLGVDGRLGGVGDNEPDDDGPKNIFDIRKGNVMRLGVSGDGLFDEFSRIAYGNQQQKAGAREAMRRPRPMGLSRLVE